MLAYIAARDRGDGDRILVDVAGRLEQCGVAVGGVVQINTEIDPDRPCQMDLRVLGDGSRIRISQNLGRYSAGCRLDPAGLEEAVGAVEGALARQTPRMLILNKFGKAETEGRGFRNVIGQALALGVPILTCVSAKNQLKFDEFAQGAATTLPADAAAVLDWCLSQISIRKE